MRPVSQQTNPDSAQHRQVPASSSYGLAREYQGLTRVIKGRSYTLPIGGRVTPVATVQGINGLVGKTDCLPGSTEHLKKERGMIMASSEQTVQSGRFMLQSADKPWPPCQVSPSPKAVQWTARPEYLHPPFVFTNPNLYPNPVVMMTRRKQGQCFSMMMKARCQQRLFYAELARNRRVSEMTSFLRRRQEGRINESNQKFEGYDSHDEALLSAVKGYILHKRKSAFLEITKKRRASIPRVSLVKKVDSKGSSTTLANQSPSD